MRIGFISSLTPHQEDELADALMTTISILLRAFPVTYALRIETAGGKVVQHHHPTGEEPSHSGRTLWFKNDATRIH